MKRKVFTYLLSAAIALSAVLTSCNKDDEETPDPSPIDEPDGFLMAGKFKNQSGNRDVVFYADYVTDANSSLRSSVIKASATEKELIGKIEDGDIIFNLKGIYDVANKQFFLSAGSSMQIFQIAGTLSDAGVMTNTEATIKVKSGDEWNVITVAVTNTDSVSIDGNASNAQEDGIPQAWFGKWKRNDSEEGVQFMMTSYQLINLELPDEPAGFLEVKSIGNGKLEMIWEMYAHYATNENGTTIERTTIEYAKVWLESSAENLVLTIFSDSESENFAETKAYTASVNDDSKMEIVMSRP